MKCKDKCGQIWQKRCDFNKYLGWHVMSSLFVFIKYLTKLFFYVTKTRLKGYISRKEAVYGGTIQTKFTNGLAVFIGLLLVILKRHSDKRWLLCINLTGIFLSVIHMSLLRELSSVDVFVHNFSKLTLILIFMGTAGTVINLISAKKRRL